MFEPNRIQCVTIRRVVFQNIVRKRATQIQQHIHGLYDNLQTNPHHRFLASDIATKTSNELHICSGLLLLIYLPAVIIVIMKVLHIFEHILWADDCE